MIEEARHEEALGYKIDRTRHLCRFPTVEDLVIVGMQWALVIGVDGVGLVLRGRGRTVDQP